MNLQEALYKCNKCGFCQAACPFYQLTREEWAVARGRLRLIKSVLEEAIPLSDGYVRRIYHCFMCGACSATCPSGVPVEDILLEARSELAHKDLLPHSLVQLSRTISATGNLTGEDSTLRLSWAQNLEFSPPQGGRRDVVYFVGCVSSFYPQAYGIPQSMVKLLEIAETDYTVLGGEEVCCGYPLLLNGLEDEARKLAAINVDKVRETGARYLLTTCPSCYRMWREFYPQLLGEDIGVEVIHSSSWLAESRLPLKPLEKKITYHDPCDLGRGSGIYDAPREFISGIEGVELVEMPYTKAEALCCGGGGNIESLDAPTSREVAKMRLAQAYNTGAELLVSACPQCKRTLSRARSRELRIPVVDITELAWQTVALR